MVKGYMNYKGCMGTICTHERGHYYGWIIFTPYTLVYQSETLEGLDKAFRDTVESHIKDTRSVEAPVGLSERI